MKFSQKALSVFMAVLMVMTSLSVGLTALAADPYDALAAALKADGAPCVLGPPAELHHGRE